MPAGLVTHVWAIADGKRVAIPFALPSIPLSGNVPTAPVLTPHGPTAVQRAAHGGTISWLMRRLPVGTPVVKNVHHLFEPSGARVIYEREIAPDPAAPERMVVSLVETGPGERQVCVNVVGGRYGGGSNCWPSDQLFSTGLSAFGTSDGVQNSVQVTGAYAPL